MAHADTGRQTRTTAAQTASAKRQAEALAAFRRRQAQASKAALETRTTAARRISTAFAPPPTEAERLGSISGRNVPSPVTQTQRQIFQSPDIAIRTGQIQPPLVRLTGGQATVPQPGQLPPNIARFVESGGAAPQFQQATGLPPNLARFVSSGGQPFNPLERRQPEGALPPGAARFVASGGELPTARGPGGDTTSAAPRTIQGTGPSPIQLGNPPQTLGDIDPLFPPGTVISRAGGTIAAQLPDGRIVDLTRVETYGQLVAESLDRWLQTGNPDMRPTNIREEWALSFSHLWENDFENVTDFLASMGYRLIPGTNGNWIRENPFNISSPASSGGGGGGFRFPGQVVQSARGSAAAPVSRGRVSSLGLTQWSI